MNTRLRAPQKSKFSQNLEKLRRELQIPFCAHLICYSYLTLHSGAKARRSLSDSEDNPGDSDEDEDDSNPGESDSGIIPGAVPPGQRIMESESEGEEEDEFIVEDEEDGDVELPLEFSMKSHSDLSHHFKSKLLRPRESWVLLTGIAFVFQLFASFTCISPSPSLPVGRSL